MTSFAQSSDSSKVEDFQLMGSPAAPAISPNGEYTAWAFRYAVIEEDKSEYRQQIWVGKTDGSWTRQYTFGEKSSWAPAFSNDSKSLFFLSDRGEKTQVYHIYLDGGEAHQATDAKEGVSSYEVSPDGSKIAYRSNDPEPKEIKDRKKAKTDITKVGEIYRYQRIYVMEIKNNPDKKAKCIIGEDVYVESFDWSPDGKTIAFAHRPNPELDERDSSNISLVPADSGAISPLVTWDGADGSPYFLSNSQIAFISDGGQPEPIGLSDVYIINVSGGTPTKLAETPNRSVSGILEGSDDKFVYVTDNFRTTNALYQIPTNGKEAKALNPADGVYSYSAGIVNGMIAFTYQNSSTPEQVFATKAKKFKATQISIHYTNTTLPKMAKQEVITWKSDDGMEIEGLLIYPINYEEGKKYPLALNVHGGPGGVFSQSFIGNGLYSGQIFAENGYFVLKPNPRGSIGYGKDFRYANFADLGEGDYNDVISGVQYVVDKGMADADKLVMMGWSYGGYMASRIATKTDMFKAISMGAGLFNLESMFVTTDVKEYGLGLMGGGYWESEELKKTWFKLSPHNMVDKVVTPVQLLHSSNDRRVPASQSEEMYAVLKYMGVDTELVLYPRSGHGPSEPKLYADITPRVLEWFKKYLD